MTKRRKPNAAYQLLRNLGMRAAIARHFLVKLRAEGFVVVEEKTITKAAQINQKLEIIIKLMKASRRRK